MNEILCISFHLFSPKTYLMVNFLQIYHSPTYIVLVVIAMRKKSGQIRANIRTRIHTIKTKKQKQESKRGNIKRKRGGGG